MEYYVTIIVTVYVFIAVVTFGVLYDGKYDDDKVAFFSLLSLFWPLVLCWIWSI